MHDQSATASPRRPSAPSDRSGPAPRPPPLARMAGRQSRAPQGRVVAQETNAPSVDGTTVGGPPACRRRVQTTGASQSATWSPGLPRPPRPRARLADNAACTARRALARDRRAPRVGASPRQELERRGRPTGRSPGPAPELDATGPPTATRSTLQWSDRLGRRATSLYMHWEQRPLRPADTGAVDPRPTRARSRALAPSGRALPVVAPPRPADSARSARPPTTRLSDRAAGPERRLTPPVFHVERLTTHRGFRPTREPPATPPTS